MKLSKIKILDANSKSLANAINYAMQKSPTTAKVVVNQCKLKDSLHPWDLTKIYPKDTFCKKEIRPEKKLEFAQEIANVLGNKKDIKDYNMLDFANGFIKIITGK